MDPTAVFAICYLLAISVIAFAESLAVPNCPELYEILLMQLGGEEDVDQGLIETIQLYCFANLAD